MKRLLLAATLAALATPAMAQVGFSMSIGQPGFYGRIDVGGYPPPQLVYGQPVIVHPGGYAGPPIYLRVPAYHAGNWNRYCRDYNACGHPVYFVQDDWYRNEYAPRYRRHHPRFADHRHDARWDYRAAPDNWYYGGYGLRHQEQERRYTGGPWRRDAGHGDAHRNDRDDRNGRGHGNDRGDWNGRGHGNDRGDRNGRGHGTERADRDTRGAGHRGEDAHPGRGR